MLSRVADSVYWLNRYIERAENIARFVDVNLYLMLDLPYGAQQQWEPLVMTTGDLGFFKQHYGEVTKANVIKFLTFDQHYSNSILSCLNMARENARSIREIISSEMWEEINRFYLMVKEAGDRPPANIADFFAQVKLSSHRFAGIMDATMTHNEAWHFGQMGRLQERADKTARILDVKYYYLLPSVEWVGTPLDQVEWIALLKSASAYEMYRKSQRRITPANVASFLILHQKFPRSIHFCLLQVQRSLHEVTGTPLGSWRNDAERALGRLCGEMGYITIEDVISQGLHEFLEEIQAKVNEVGVKMAQTFFVNEPVLSPVPVQSQSQTQQQSLASF
ncbi:alpha-E domain-containing protein [Synechocystis sp. PCC 7339]|uniref:alpha-E domain-containing protein n=1 Tax=Synechocystis sp. PCC 7339 TaxID=2782213 RepID=UPI001CC1242E|nr:alpha-E domain-containing protein [Synechocystis sp. PCC 7339]UAJ71624.1 alpha-E domain-containing protein [Synechocystis sp. PCC 7339]